jgi:hypothetical protein
VAFLLNQPQIIHCFTAVVEADKNLDHPLACQAWSSCSTPPPLQGNPYVVRFRIVGRENQRSG